MNKNIENSNVLAGGDFSSIKDTLLGVAFKGKESNEWSNKGKLLLSSILESLIILRDKELMFEIDKCNEINSIEDIYKYKKSLTVSDLKKILESTENIFEFCFAMDRVYNNNGIDFTNTKLHQPVINTLLQLVNGLDSWENVSNKGSFDNVQKSLSSEDFYELNIAKSFFADLF